MPIRDSMSSNDKRAAGAVALAVSVVLVAVIAAALLYTLIASV